MVEIKERIRFTLENSSDTAHVILSVRDFAALAGFSDVDNSLLATAVSELSTNIIKFAGRGSISLGLISDGDRRGIRISAEDSGPGIEDIERALRENFSTEDSLGLGLPSVKRIMDTFDIVSFPGRGTRIDVLKWRES